jgi:hypothetical protein
MTNRLNADSGPRLSWNETSDRVEMCADDVRVAFERTGALWTHSVTVSVGGETLEIATSLESDPDRDDPRRVVSPVYQEVHRHPGDAESELRLLLTGTLFGHHFSTVATLQIVENKRDELTFDLDIADRCRSVVESLAATYTVRLGTGSLADASRERAVWTGVGGGRLELLAVAPSTLVVAEAGRNATRAQVLATIDPASHTHRLHYRWRWASNSGLTL